MSKEHQAVWSSAYGAAFARMLLDAVHAGKDISSNDLLERIADESRAVADTAVEFMEGE